MAAIDALVVARCAFESSMIYRSAALFGSCAPVADTAADTVAALDLVAEGLLLGRVAPLRPPSAKELAATPVLRMTVDQWTLKVSEGWPEDGPADVASPAWAGILPLCTRYERAIPTPDLISGITQPESVLTLLGTAETAPSVTALAGYSPMYPIVQA